ncbi:hypothetical protein SLEP1_g45010 [Rubroshorea leprosula]|uniref:Uncharacterized protein n=1 Tax=Rubroshorea leprosula TaxID=152421 RepID=A0AAV5LJC1_9ROSI|nr:hypothetical protein SLEP1_g45010 [Rubroshorea leprosula]
MMKEVRYIQNWGEVAPTLLICHHKNSRRSKLETILEEGCENSVVVPKRIVYLLPIVLSMLLYFMFCRNLARA